MYNILTLNKISEAGLSLLPAADYHISEEEQNPDGIILRSFSMHDMELTKSLRAVARAGAGTNNIPIEKCTENGIVVFNTPGANANAVKELVLTAMLISSRKIVDGIEWVKGLKGQENVDKLVEKGKAQFVGPEISGKKLGVIGLGAIGVLVANMAKKLGMEVLGYDPFLSVDAAWSLSSGVIKAESVEAIASQCDYITMHIPLNDKTRNLFNKELFACTKKGARLLNFSRGELVNLDDLEVAIKEGIISCYVTDFADDKVLGMENTIVTPHIGASTPESEDNCAAMAAQEIKEFLEYGTIKNSVNFPDCEVAYTGKRRISVINKNIPNMVGSIASAFAKFSINIDNMLNKSRGGYAYTLVDADDLMGKEKEIIEELLKVEGIVAARVVR